MCPQKQTLQVKNYGDWPERSLVYLSRSISSLKKGLDYRDIPVTIHIGLLDFSLFPDSPEFFATYRLMNVKTHKIYSDKIMFAVLDLSKINLATEDDKQKGLDLWAALFKSTTWEELIALSKKSKGLKEAVSTVYAANADEKIRWQAWAREDYERRQNSMRRQRDSLRRRMAELEAENAKQQAENARQQAENARQQAEITKQQAEITALKKQLALLQSSPS